MAVINVHIGYPKCFSTALQRHVFCKHDQIHYGGIAVNDKIDYANDAINILFESVLKYANDYFFDDYLQTKSKKLEDFIHTAGQRKIVFSSEHLSMNFGLQGLDNRLKYERLKKVFNGHELRILVIERDPISLIRSLYSEMVRMGYFGTYVNYLEWILMTYDRNFIFDLNFKFKLQQLRSILGGVEITNWSFEEIVSGNAQELLNVKTSEWLAIDNNQLAIPKTNPTLSYSELNELQSINNKMRREIGASQLEPFERHRSYKIIENAPIEFSEELIFENVLLKRQAMLQLEENVNDLKSLNPSQRESELEQKITEIIDAMR